MRTTMTAFALLMIAGCATTQPASDPLADFYGNTWNMYSAEGLDRFHINGDGSWSGVFHDGLKVSGTWSIKSDQLCFHSPQFPDNTHCESGLFGKRVNDTWSSINEGEEHVSIVHAGRE